MTIIFFLLKGEYIEYEVGQTNVDAFLLSTGLDTLTYVDSDLVSRYTLRDHSLTVKSPNGSIDDDMQIGVNSLILFHCIIFFLHIHQFMLICLICF